MSQTIHNSDLEYQQPVSNDIILPVEVDQNPMSDENSNAQDDIGIDNLSKFATGNYRLPN